MKLMYEWKLGDDDSSSANPYDGRFTLSVEKSKSSQKWTAMVNGNALTHDENEAVREFANAVEAQVFAEALYDNYWVDFDE